MPVKSLEDQNSSKTNALRRLDRLEWSKWHTRTTFILGCGWCMDAFETQIAISSIAQVSATFSLPTGGQERTWITSVWTFGGIFGALFFGYLCDVFGRKTTFLLTLIMYSVFTLITAMSPVFWFFLVARGLTSIGVAAEYSAVTASVAEFVPSKFRGQMTTLVLGLWSVGAIVASGVNALVLPHTGVNVGWRIAFSLGGLSSLFVLWARRKIPESPRFLINKGRVAEADAVVQEIEIASLQPNNGKGIPAVSYPKNENRNLFHQLAVLCLHYPFRTMFACLLDLSQAFGGYGMASFLNVSLLPLSGIPESDYPFFNLIGSISALPGTLVVVLLIDRIGRKTLLPIAYFIAAVSSCTMYPAAISGSTTWLYIASAFYNFGYTLAWNTSYPMYPEIFPTQLRSTGIGFAVAVGRAGGVAAPILLTAVFNTGPNGQNYTGSIGLVASFFLVTCIAAIPYAYYAVEGKGRSLEDAVGTD